MTAVSASFLLILARDLAANCATPMFVIDSDLRLVFYNEGAEKILGRSYAESGEMTAEEWGTLWEPTDVDGKVVPPEKLPLSVAFSEHHPASSVLRIKTMDGKEKTINVIGFPLLPQKGEVVGALAIFWETEI